MMSSGVLAEIPADVRPVLEAYYRRKLAERYGASAPGPEQEAAFVRELLAASGSVVPLMDGGEAVIAGDRAWDDEAAYETVGSAPGDRDQTRNAGLFFLMVGLVVVLAFGRDIAGWVGFGDGGGSGDDGEGATPTPTGALFTPVALPSGLDDVVTATGVRVPLVVPRTLEVGATTFAVLPVQVDVADWPCPRQEQAVACWVYGTVVNYLVGVPADQVSPALVQGLGPGDVLRLRLSSGRIIDFVVEGAQDVPRQNVEVLDQRRFGLTLVFLEDQILAEGRAPVEGQVPAEDQAPAWDQVPAGGQNETRRVVWAAYDARQDLFGAEIPVGDQAPVGDLIPAGGGTPPASSPVAVGGGATPTPPRHTLALGQTATDGPARVTPVMTGVISGRSHLRLRVENDGETTLSTSGWSAQVRTPEKGVIEGTIEEKQILPGQIDFVSCTAEDAGAWEITTGAMVLAVEP
jgi:hypothetical protein